MADPFSLQPHTSSSDDQRLGLGRGNNNNDHHAAAPTPPPPHPPSSLGYSGYGDRASYSGYEYTTSDSRGTDSPASEYGQYFSAASNGGFQQQQQQAGEYNNYARDSGTPYMQEYNHHPQYYQTPYAMQSDATALDGGQDMANGGRAFSTEKVEAPLLLAAAGGAGALGAAAAMGGAADRSPASYKGGKGRQGGRRRCCGGGRYCFCFSKRCCLIFIPILIIVLAGLGVLFYFIFPRIPSVTFREVDVAQPSANGPTGKDTTVSDIVSGATINRSGVVTVPLVIHLNVTNPNFIPWTIHNVTVTGYLKNPAFGGDNFPVGTGGLRTPFWMPQKSVGNDMPIYFNFRLDTNNTNYLPAAQTVQAACTAGGPKLEFYYQAQVILKAISWLGIKPSISNTIEFACPISQINDLGIQISDLTGLGLAGLT
ncbi:hypothetical protein IWW38_000602 [Coemansia aciculifera]|uniref:Uncharacterized protein n=1 Tax=Coemansia aciculifera TaxID=417176 RepID=A0ACC1M8K4_9FUNG|nr:hypothetical protein IWW38_000602 [Coemansia aciculifera]